MFRQLPPVRPIRFIPVLLIMILAQHVLAGESGTIKGTVHAVAMGGGNGAVISCR